MELQGQVYIQWKYGGSDFSESISCSLHSPFQKLHHEKSNDNLSVYVMWDNVDLLGAATFVGFII
jgi:hypothetical protein